MRRGGKSKSALAGAAAVACLALGCLAAGAVVTPAFSAPVAKEQYVLTLPGVPQAGADGAAAPRGPTAAASGISGDRREPHSRLGALTAAALSPAALGVALVLAGAAAVAIGRRRRR